METTLTKQPKTEIAKTSSDTNPMTLIEIAITQNADVDKLEKLLDLQMKWEANVARKKFFEALSAFQNEMPVVTKNKAVKFNQTSYNYATLDNIISEIKQHLNKNGLAYRWEFEDADKIVVKCIITHIAGHSESTTMSSSTDKSGSKNDIQSRGSSLTYLQRYTLIGALGIGTAQDDVDTADVKNKNPLEEKQIVELTDEVKKIISEFKTNAALVEWVKLNDKYNTNPEFKTLCKAKQAELKGATA